MVLLNGQRDRATRRGEHKATIECDRPDLSLSNKCRLLSISRFSFHYALRGEGPSSLALMRHIDELFPKCPLYGSPQMVRRLPREGTHVGRHRGAPNDAPDGFGGHLPGFEN